ncbi:DUF3313 domain-containing protein [Pseudomonas sp. PGPR40]|uniref:DUF3313 domain-containing protein n=1 Tax=Pseudomonas sp. PGPR40 TaxID=2913476 RepID=UPI001EDB7E5A|nr:DUF3313 domain-containing protein [Pseudomonas sp. PGPR40]
MACSINLSVVIGLSCLLLGGCVSRTTDKEQYSGYLDRYDVLESTLSPSGAPTLRWVSPAFRSKNYDMVIFDPLILYPAPKANDRVDMQTFERLRRAADTRAYEVLSKRYRVIGSQDPIPFASRYLVLHTAITGVSASNEEMRWYELIPVAAVIGGVNVAIGQRDQNSELYVEALLVNAANEPMIRVARKVLGKTLDNNKIPITADDFTEAIETLVADMGELLK